MKVNTDSKRVASLKEISSLIQYGFTASATTKKVGPRFLRITDIQNGKVNWDDVPFCLCNESNKYLLKDGDIVFARTGATTGKSFIIENAPEAVFASYLIRLKLKPTVFPKFVYYFFQSKNYWNHINRNIVGSTQGGFNASKLAEIIVPQPDFKAQQRIANILAHADTAREKRRQANQMAEQFLQSAFFEMFGDPVRNEKGWKVKKLEEIAAVNPKMNLDERTLPNDTVVSFIPMASVDDKEGRIVIYLERKIGEVKKGFTYFRNNDILFAKITPCMENGKVAIAKGLMNQIGFGTTEFHVIRCEKLLIPEYVYSILRMRHIRDIAEKNMTGSAGQQRVPSNFIKNFKIPIPPLPLQQKFAKLVERVEQLRAKQRQSEIELDNLFNSLMRMYFG